MLRDLTAHPGFSTFPVLVRVHFGRRPPQVGNCEGQTLESAQRRVCRTDAERNDPPGDGYWPSRSLQLRIDDLNRTNFYAAASLEDGTVFRHCRRLIQAVGPHQKISADEFLAFGKWTIS